MSTAIPRTTPMLRQYFEMKSRVPDAILLYRMGDFYEMFFDDARDAAPLLGIALTARNRDSDIEAPMGLVRRDITRVVTPGTVLDPESLSPGAPSYLAAVAPLESGCGLAFLDLSTGRFLAGAVPVTRVADAFALFRPREILLPDGADAPGFAAALSRRPVAWWNGASEAFALDGGLADAP